jgi:uncharacterized protein (DUF1778 family)
MKSYKKTETVRLSAKEKKFILRACKAKKWGLSTFLRNAGLTQAMVILQEDYE